MNIPFNRPECAGNELSNISDAIKRLKISGDGYYGKLCEDLLESLLGAPRVLLTTSCTHALELAALLLNLGPGDEVILPTFTFVSTANAFALRGCTPVFADIREDTLNLDEENIEQLVSDKTKAIVPVHYAGIGCNMDSISAIAERRGLSVIEDNAHGLFGKYKGRSLGTFGSLGVQSFHETKNVICGEGGALVVNDRKLIERAEIIREKGTDRSRFFRGDVDKYTWQDLGSSYVISDILAAFLYAQLEAHKEIQGSRRRIWERYNVELREWARLNGVKQPVVPDLIEPAWHLYHLVMQNKDERDYLLARLNKLNVGSVFHYLPLHLSPMGLGYDGKSFSCPVAERVSDRILRLPVYHGLTADEQSYVIEKILGWGSS